LQPTVDARLASTRLGTFKDRDADAARASATVKVRAIEKQSDGAP
jgi:hypothetical protein